MPALEELLDRSGQRLHVGSVSSLDLHRMNAFHRRHVLDYSDWHHNGLISDFGLSERASSLFERSHHRELQPVQLYNLANGILGIAKEPHRQLFGEHHYM